MLTALTVTGQGLGAIAFCQRHPQIIWDMFLFCITSALGMHCSPPICFKMVYSRVIVKRANVYISNHQPFWASANEPHHHNQEILYRHRLPSLLQAHPQLATMGWCYACVWWSR